MKIILNWIISALAVLLAAAVVPGIHVSSFWTALIVALVLGIINLIIRPVLLILTFPITILTLGLFVLVVNGLMLWLAASIVKGFEVDGFLAALLGALIISVIHMIVHSLEKRSLHN